MKIALLTDGIYPYVLGGMQKHSFYLAKYLAKQRVYVDLYHTGPIEADTVSLRGFTEAELAYIKPIHIGFPAFGNLPGHYIFESFRYSEAIFKHLVANGPVDFIYAQGFCGWKTIMEKKRGRLLPPIGINFHGIEMFQVAPTLHVRLQHLLLREPVKYNLRHADFAYSLGGRLTYLLKNITDKTIFEIPIGIEANWLNKATSDEVSGIRTFIFIGRYERRKGIEELHQALKSLDKNLNYKFYFIGPIPPDKQLKQKNIIYLGLIKNEQEIKDVLAGADVLVCPSYSEGMPTVILEAMASGLAIIATDVGAVSALVSKKNGWIVPTGNQKALVLALTEAIKIDDRELFFRKEASKLKVQTSFTWDKVINYTIEHFKSIVS